MISRVYETRVREKLFKFPAATLLGPRQCGKTTLAKDLGGQYYDMEIESHRVKLDAEWPMIAESEELIIIDEAQELPSLFQRLRPTIDEDRKRMGRFLLLGSVSPSLIKNVAESLAGRMGIIKMGPLILTELSDERLEDLWMHGGYPDGGVLDKTAFPDWQQDYMTALATRDLPNWGLPSKPRQTQRLFTMLAACHGQTLNASKLGRSLELDHKTVTRYCDFLEEAYLIRLLHPYSANVRKRIVKAPKVYWRDSGLLHTLLNTRTQEQLYAQPWYGHSWEGFVIEQILSSLEANGHYVMPYCFRTSDGYELDLVLDWGSHREAIEIKLTSNPTTGMIDRLKKTAEMIQAERYTLLCRCKDTIENENLIVANLPNWLERVRSR